GRGGLLLRPPGATTRPGSRLLLRRGGGLCLRSATGARLLCRGGSGRLASLLPTLLRLGGGTLRRPAPATSTAGRRLTGTLLISLRRLLRPGGLRSAACSRGGHPLVAVSSPLLEHGRGTPRPDQLTDPLVLGLQRVV